MLVKSFTIYVARFRFLESSQQKLRPVIAIGKLYGEHRILAVIPVSASAHQEIVDVSITNWRQCGLLKPSVARVHRLTAMLEADLLQELGAVDDAHRAAITNNLKSMLGIS
jgi:hypothetical protein